MYSGKNPTAIQSQIWIRDAFLKLLKAKSYDIITIKEITQHADLARQTFYKLFDNKEEILEYHLNGLFKTYIALISNKEIRDLKQIIQPCFEFFVKEKVFINILIDSQLTCLLNRKFRDYLNELGPLLDKDKQILMPDYMTAFISGALVEVLIYWIQQNNPASSNDLTLFVCNILEKPFSTIIKKNNSGVSI